MIYPKPFYLTIIFFLLKALMIVTSNITLLFKLSFFIFVITHSPSILRSLGIYIFEFFLSFDENVRFGQKE